MRALWLEDRQLRLRDDLPKPERHEFVGEVNGKRVVGHGKLGQLIAQTLALTGYKLTVVGRVTRKVLPSPLECGGRAAALRH